MAKVIKLVRKVRPLKKTYYPMAPYEVEREDLDDGTIEHHVVDMRPDSYRTVVTTRDYEGDNPYSKFDAEQIVKGLNMLVQYGMEKLPNVKERD
jgi:hypothetical protein